MEIASVMPISLVDFPGHVSLGVYTQGCSKRCDYCHNKPTWAFKRGVFTWGCVLERIKDRAGFINGVVFSGGEPTEQPDLLGRVLEVRDLGLDVGLHTNGERLTVEIARECEYILLSHFDAVKLEIASNAAHLSTSEVINNNNVIKVLK